MHDAPHARPASGQLHIPLEHVSPATAAQSALPQQFPLGMHAPLQAF
jgi:hypothetical protein